MARVKELKEVADKIYLEYRLATGETYGEVNRRYSEARRVYEEAKEQEASDGN